MRAASSETAAWFMPSTGRAVELVPSERFQELTIHTSSEPMPVQLGPEAFSVTSTSPVPIASSRVRALPPLRAASERLMNRFPVAE